MPRILLAGVAALDSIHQVPRYPREDEELRALRHITRPGGNAANSASVLAGLGHEVALLSLWGDDDAGRRVERELAGRGVDLRLCRRVAGGTTATSHIVLSRATGSRTIVHVRDLEELELADFARVDLGAIDWIHFEARNVARTARAMAAARAAEAPPAISLEVEKERPEVETLWPAADLIVFSRAFARGRGFDSAPALLHQVRGHAPRARLACAWGDQGAFGLDTNGHAPRARARPPAEIVDTIGAGDVFNAGLIDALARGATFAAALERGCALAGAKVGRLGFDGLR